MVEEGRWRELRKWTDGRFLMKLDVYLKRLFSRILVYIGAATWQTSLDVLTPAIGAKKVYD